MALSVLVPIATLLLMSQLLAKQSACWRTGAIHAAVLWGAVVVIITESLEPVRNPH